MRIYPLRFEVRKSRHFRLSATCPWPLIASSFLYLTQNCTASSSQHSICPHWPDILSASSDWCNVWPYWFGSNACATHARVWQLCRDGLRVFCVKCSLWYRCFAGQLKAQYSWQYRLAFYAFDHSPALSFCSRQLELSLGLMYPFLSPFLLAFIVNAESSE